MDTSIVTENPAVTQKESQPMDITHDASIPVQADDSASKRKKLLKLRSGKLSHHVIAFSNGPNK